MSRICSSSLLRVSYKGGRLKAIPEAINMAMPVAEPAMEQRIYLWFFKIPPS